MIKVLLLGVGGNVSQGILKAIRNSELPIHIVGACVSYMSVGLYMCDEAIISPYAKDENFIQWVIEICHTKNIDIIMTGVEEIVLELEKNREKLESCSHAIFVSSSLDKLVIGQDKYLTSKWLKDNNCNYPKFCLLENKDQLNSLVAEVGYPLILKPRSGKSSNGVYKVIDATELEKYAELTNYIVQQYVGDEDSEYTVGCYCSKTGILQNIIIMNRKLKNGTTIYAKVVDNENICLEIKKICQQFKPNGPFNVQLRLDKDGRPVPFEFNVRFSGTTAIRSIFGYRDVEAEIREYILKEDISKCFIVRHGEVFRYDEELYLFDSETNKMKDNCYANFSNRE